MRKNIFALALIALVILAFNNAFGQSRQPQRAPAALPSLVKEFWARNAAIKIESDPNDRLIDILVSSLIHAEVVDKIVSLKRRSGSALSSEQLEKLRKQTDPELEQTISAFPDGQAKTEAESIFKFYGDAQRVIDIKNGPEEMVRPTGSDALSLQLASLNRAQFVDMIASYKRRMGTPLTAEAEKELLNKSFDFILILHLGAQREYLVWSRSKNGNQSKR